MCALVGGVVIAQAVAQTLAGITLPMGVYIGCVGSWVRSPSGLRRDICAAWPTASRSNAKNAAR
jgi:hypothetical protein